MGPELVYTLLEEKKVSWPCWEWNHNSLIVQLNAFLTSLICRRAVTVIYWPLYRQGKSSSYLFGRRFDGPRTGLYTFGREKSVLALLGMEPQFLDCPACSLVTIPNELFQLLY